MDRRVGSFRPSEANAPQLATGTNPTVEPPLSWQPCHHQDHHRRRDGDGHRDNGKGQLILNDASKPKRRGTDRHQQRQTRSKDQASYLPTTDFSLAFIEHRMGYFRHDWNLHGRIESFKLPQDVSQNRAAMRAVFPMGHHVGPRFTRTVQHGAKSGDCFFTGNRVRHDGSPSSKARRRWAACSRLFTVPLGTLSRSAMSRSERSSK